jgi:hypothetical protein
MQGSIVVTAKAWLNPVLENRFLERWNDCTTGANMQGALTGGLFGLALPESKYGLAGQAISKLAILRLYQGAKVRGDQWKHEAEQTPVLLVADEVQNLASSSDIEFIPIARSLGVTALFATQNIDGLDQKIGKQETEQLLGNFANIIAFDPKTNRSNEWLSKRTGSIWRATVEQFNGFPSSRFSISAITNSGAAKRIHETKDEVRIDRNVSLGRTAFVAGSEDNALYSGVAHTGFKALIGAIIPDEPDMKEPYATVNIKPTSILDEKEIGTMLSNQGSAVAILRRGGVPRIDIIQTQYMESFSGGVNSGN